MPVLNIKFRTTDTKEASFVLGEIAKLIEEMEDEGTIPEGSDWEAGIEEDFLD